MGTQWLIVWDAYFCNYVWLVLQSWSLVSCMRAKFLEIFSCFSHPERHLSENTMSDKSSGSLFKISPVFHQIGAWNSDSWNVYSLFSLSAEKVRSWERAEACITFYRRHLQKTDFSSFCNKGLNIKAECLPKLTY